MESELQLDDVSIVYFADNGKYEFLIKWHSLPSFETCWDVLTDIQEQFPHFLFDKSMTYELWNIRY